ncbi:MAG: YdcF family protein [Flavobacteriaceae bacterium]|nr:YdcF family protein [Flavobacteriaceae bacterium]
MKYLKALMLSLLFIAASIIVPHYIIKNNAKQKTYSSVVAIPKNKVGLVLGTGKHLSNGNINLYYKYRVDATINLYLAGKITHVLVSGDNSRKGYDEPTDFKNDLIQGGIPSHKIYLDYAGFRTLDSIIRAKEIFGLNNITIISQKFHNERAIYLAEKHDIEAIGFNAKTLKGRYAIKTEIRELLARTKACIDILFNTKPKFLGSKIEIK